MIVDLLRYDNFVVRYWVLGIGSLDWVDFGEMRG